MNQENEPIDEIPGDLEPEHEVGGVTVAGKNARLWYAAIGAAVLIVLLIFAGWYLFLRGPEGKPVPAPRDTAFNGPSGGKPVPEGERVVTLTEEQLKAAGLKIVTVGESLEGTAVNATTTGVVKANEYEETPVISQVRGVVRSINAELGSFVRRGETVAVIASDELAAVQADLLTRRAELDEAQKRYKRALGLSEISEESRNELDQTAARLKAADAKLIETKVNLERSKKLATIGAISRRELEIAETEFATAGAMQKEAADRFERAKQLLKINPARRNEIDSYLTMVRTKESEVGAVREKLLVLGLPKGRIDSLRSPSQIRSDLPVTSPVSGTVTKRSANRGEVISMNGTLASVTDLSTVWVIAQVYEKELGKLRVGSGAGVTSDAYPGRYFRGSITYVDPELDSATRTAQVRIELPNAGQELKIGMYVNVAFATLGGMENTTPLVPEAAVQFIGEEQVVFEATEDPLKFVIRTVVLFDKKDGFYPVKRGIFVGDKVVGEGSFLLRAEWLKSN